MPPRSRFAKGTPAVLEECKRSLAEWRRIAQLGVAKASPAAGGVPAAMAAPSSSSASGNFTAAVNPLKRQALRNDMPVIKNARRGGAAQAIEATQSAGLHSLISDLYRDREAASGVGATFSHLATWTKFHVEIYGPFGDSNWTPVLPLTPE